MAMPGRDGFFVGLPTMMRDNPCAATIPSVHRNPAHPCTRLRRLASESPLKRPAHRALTKPTQARRLRRATARITGRYAPSEP
ncbi:hypothetical protein EYC56_01290 [Xanthomonas oryzae]|nr:hypothetical protein EYC56_01290 [Xanthomonas oryzae]